jgi:hypothetical protein
MPPEGTLLPEWPEARPLVVPVLVDAPSERCDYLILVDRPSRTEPVRHPPLVVDGGVLVLNIAIDPLVQNPPIDTTSCHEILVVVAPSFQNNQPDPLGSGDSVGWTYPCPFDAAAFRSASSDAAADGLAFAPQPDGGDL